MMGVVTKDVLISSNPFDHAGVKSNLTYLHRRAVRGLAILLKFFMNLLKNPACPRKLRTCFTIARAGVGVKIGQNGISARKYFF